MKHDEIVDGEAMSAIEGRLGHKAPLPNEAVLRHLRRAISLFPSQRQLAICAGIPQPSLNRMAAGERAIYAEAAVAIEAATQGLVHRGQLRPDLWLGYEAVPTDEPDDALDVTHLLGLSGSQEGPDQFAREEVAIRAYLAARHRLEAAKTVLMAVMGIDRA